MNAEIILKTLAGRFRGKLIYKGDNMIAWFDDVNNAAAFSDDVSKLGYITYRCGTQVNITK